MLKIKPVKNNVSKVGIVIKSYSKNKQVPIDSIIIVFKMLQNVYSYNFLRGYTGFENFQLKIESAFFKKHRTDIVFPQIVSMKQIILNIVSKENLLRIQLKKVLLFDFLTLPLRKSALSEVV